MVRGCPPNATLQNTMAPSTADATSARQVTSCAPRSPIQRPKKPAMKAAISGRKTAATCIERSALHPIDVFDRDGAAVAEIDHKDGKADRRFGRRHGQNKHGEDLADEIVQERREGDEIDVHRQQHQLDRHQDDDDVLTIQKNAEDAEREQDGGDGEVVREADLQHHAPSPGRTLTISIVSSRRRETWRAMRWRRVSGRRRWVSTMAPIIATSRTAPAVWKA